MLCKRFKEICDEQGWTVSDNGSHLNIVYGSDEVEKV